MADLFGRTDQIYNGGLTTDASWMFWGALPNGGLGLLVTQMSIQYQQPVRRIFEIGPWVGIGQAGPTTGGGVAPSIPLGQPVYYVVGRPEGQMQIARIAGPVAVLGGFYRMYGNPCNYMNSLLFVSASGCAVGASGNATIPQSALTPPAAGVPVVANAAPFPANDNFAAPNAKRVDPFLGWYMNGVILTSVGLQTQSQEMLLNENTSMMFVGLKLFVNNTSDPLSGVNWTEV